LIRSCPQPKGKRPQRDWIDLSFLTGQPQKVIPEGHGILEVHFSFVICGSDNLRWTAYAFSDEDEEDEEEEEEEEDELGAEGIPGGGFNRDPISDGLDADIPIWNVKEYFIKVVKNRMNRVLRRWEYLVRGIETIIKQRVSKIFAVLARPGIYFCSLFLSNVQSRSKHILLKNRGDRQPALIEPT
jgi:hypothetical protein